MQTGLLTSAGPSSHMYSTRCSLLNPCHKECKNRRAVHLNLEELSLQNHCNASQSSTSSNQLLAISHTPPTDINNIFEMATPSRAQRLSAIEKNFTSFQRITSDPDITDEQLQIIDNRLAYLKQDLHLDEKKREIVDKLLDDEEEEREKREKKRMKKQAKER